jgi:hypothetical protein
LGGNSRDTLAFGSGPEDEPEEARGSKMFRRLLVSGVAALGLWTIVQPPASADCIKLDVRIQWANGDPDTTTPWPPDYCVVPTPFPTFSEPEFTHNDPSATPPAPRHVHVKAAVVWPLP